MLVFVCINENKSGWYWEKKDECESFCLQRIHSFSAGSPETSLFVPTNAIPLFPMALKAVQKVEANTVIKVKVIRNLGSARIDSPRF